MILELNEELVVNFRDILIAITLTEPIDPEQFRQICFDTARLWINNYSWYNMPCSVHKILIHGSDVMSNSILPLGSLLKKQLKVLINYIEIYEKQIAVKHHKKIIYLTCFIVDSKPAILS